MALLILSYIFIYWKNMELLGFSTIFMVPTLLCKVPWDNVYYDLAQYK